MIQIIGFSIAHNRKINFGHLIMEEVIKNHQYVRENYMLYPRFLQIALDLKLTDAHQVRYARSRLIEPSVLSLRPAMVLLNNAHYPNVVLPARVTDHIQQFFNTLGLVAEVEQVEADEEDREGGDDQDIDSTTAQSESMNLDQAGASSLPKTPVNPNTEGGEVVATGNVPEQSHVNPIPSNNLTFDLSDFFGSEYLSFLDSTEPTSFSLSEPSVAIPAGKESGIPPVLTHAEEQQTTTLFTHLPLKRKLLYVNERVNLKSPKSNWFNLFVLEDTALPPPKMRKIDHEASVTIISIQSPEPNTSPIQISEDELTESKGGDTNSKLPPIILSKVSTSPGSPTLDPKMDIHCSDSSDEVRKLSDNSSSDESDRVFQTQNPSQGQEGNMGSPLPNLTLPTLPLLEGTFLAPEQEVPPTKSDGAWQELFG